MLILQHRRPATRSKQIQASISVRKHHSVFTFVPSSSAPEPVRTGTLHAPVKQAA